MMDRPDIFKDLITMRSSGPVKNPQIVKCRCGVSVVPKHGGNWPGLKLERNMIYAPDNVRKYVCGSCGNTWDRREYTTPTTERDHSGASSRGKDHYTQPGPGEGMPRQRKRGFNYRIVIVEFDDFFAEGRKINDDQRMALYGDIVKVNAKHPDYQSILKQKDHSIILNLYERLSAWHAVIEHEYADFDKEKYSEMIKKVEFGLYVWFQTQRELMNKEEFEKKKKSIQEEEPAAPKQTPTAEQLRALKAKLEGK
jgi:hypothetical protein